MRETRRADQMRPGVRVRFLTDRDVYAGTIAATRPVVFTSDELAPVPA